MAFKKKGSGIDDCPPQQRRYPGVRGDVDGTARPTASYVDYETDSDEEFQITQASSGHESFMYKSTTRGKKEGRD
jgi:hypothetical protein